MSKLTQIQQELQAIDAARFQRLGDSYLTQQSRFEDLKPIGSVIGADKVKQGIPDSLITLPEGGYALVHYTTTKDRGDLFRKLKDDLEDSFDESKTHISHNEIKEVILLHNNYLSTEEEGELYASAQRRNCGLRVIGLERIANELLDKYPGLAELFLGIDVDTRQIIRPRDFITLYNKSALSARLDTKFHFRETEVSSALEALKTRTGLINGCRQEW